VHWRLDAEPSLEGRAVNRAVDGAPRGGEAEHHVQVQRIRDRLQDRDVQRAQGRDCGDWRGRPFRRSAGFPAGIESRAAQPMVKINSFREFPPSVPGRALIPACGAGDNCEKAFRRRGLVNVKQIGNVVILGRGGPPASTAGESYCRREGIARP